MTSNFGIKTRAFHVRQGGVHGPSHKRGGHADLMRAGFDERQCFVNARAVELDGDRLALRGGVAKASAKDRHSESQTAQKHDGRGHEQRGRFWSRRKFVGWRHDVPWDRLCKTDCGASPAERAGSGDRCEPVPTAN